MDLIIHDYCQIASIIKIVFAKRSGLVDLKPILDAVHLASTGRSEMSQFFAVYFMYLLIPSTLEYHTDGQTV